MDQLPIEIIGEIFGQLKWKNWALALALTCKKYLLAFYTTNVKYVHFSYGGILTPEISIYYGNIIIFRTYTRKKHNGIKNFDIIAKIISNKPKEFEFPYNSHNEEEVEQSMKNLIFYFCLPTDNWTIAISKQISSNSFIKEIISIVKDTPVFDYFGAKLQFIDEYINNKKNKGIPARKMGHTKES